MIAALILAHHSPLLLGRLIKRLERYGVRPYVHIDGGVDIAPFLEACSGTMAVFVEPRTKIHWGGFSIMQATLTLLAAAISVEGNNHFALLSGDSYPIKPCGEFRQMLKRPFDQVNWSIVSPENPTYQRISQVFLPDTPLGTFLYRRGDPTQERVVTAELVNEFERIRLAFVMKQTAFPWRYAKGSQWWVLTRTTAQRCLEVLESEHDFVEWFRYSSVPDESLIHTILENFGPFQVAIGSPVYTYWGKWPKPYIFKDGESLQMLMDAPAPLARKFSITDGTLILELLDEWMDTAFE